MYLTKRYEQLLKQHRLDDFEKLWSKKIDWFEEPNYKRGGWSGVGHFVSGSGQFPLDIFVKKQKNFGRKTLRHPKAGEPTFRREFHRLQFLEKHGVNAARVVFYDEKHDGSSKAILITETLVGYEPLDIVLARYYGQSKKTKSQRLRLIKKVAKMVRRFHDTGLQHRALFPKHIFVKEGESALDVALIDLEKARFNVFLLRRAYYDLAKLNKHTVQLSNTERLYFLQQYFQVPTLNWLLKRFARKVIQRSDRKNK